VMKSIHFIIDNDNMTKLQWLKVCYLFNNIFTISLRHCKMHI